MPTRLNQIIAVVQGKKARTTRLLTDAHRGWNEKAISGISKIYTPKDEEGDSIPPEQKKIHLHVPEKITETVQQMTSFWDAVATQEHGNTGARASVVVDDKPLLRDQPVTVLLFLEKQLVDMHTFVSQLPVLPPDREWKLDSNRNCYVTKPIESIRTQKQPRPVVKYEATKEHPAQTELFTEDVTVGTWETTYMSSAIPSRQKTETLRRIEKLQDAVKTAREEANSTEVKQEQIASRVMSFIFGDLIQETRVQS